MEKTERHFFFGAGLYAFIISLYFINEATSMDRDLLADHFLLLGLAYMIFSL